MAVVQQRAPGFFGPANAAVQSRRKSMRRRTAGHGTVRLPPSAALDLARLGAAARRVANGDTGAAIGALERTLLQRTSLGPTLNNTARIDAIGYDAYLDEQLNFEQLDDSELEDALRKALPTLTMSVGQIWGQYNDNPFIPVFELWVATVFRALYSPRQLYERMVVFWSDHFSIDIEADTQWLLKPVDDRQVVRANAMSSFPELLSASAHSPAMLIYLTNDTNEKNHPNENYGRELMELHTLGADNGYTETDVKEVARCFTGWTFEDPYRPLGEPGAFRFVPGIHDTRAKTVLGRRIPAGGDISDGERVLQILSGHKNTAEFIATKMLRYLWGYEPPKSAVRAVRRAYKRSDGDIRTMLRTALRQQRLVTATTKLKRPFHLFISSLRALGADVHSPGFVLEQLELAGHRLFGWTPPDGYPDDDDFWSGFVLPRWNFTAGFLQSDTGVSIDPAIDDPSAPVATIVDRIDTLLLGGTMSDDTRTALTTFLKKGRRSRKKVRDAIGLALASPEFQEY